MKRCLNFSRKFSVDIPRRTHLSLQFRPLSLVYKWRSCIKKHMNIRFQFYLVWNQTAIRAKFIFITINFYPAFQIIRDWIQFSQNRSQSEFFKRHAKKLTPLFTYQLCNIYMYTTLNQIILPLILVSFRETRRYWIPASQSNSST